MSNFFLIHKLVDNGWQTVLKISPKAVRQNKDLFIFEFNLIKTFLQLFWKMSNLIKFAEKIKWTFINSLCGQTIVSILPYFLFLPRPQHPYTHFSPEPLENCRYHNTSSLNTYGQNILLCNQNKIIKPKKFYIDTLLLSNM